MKKCTLFFLLFFMLQSCLVNTTEKKIDNSSLFPKKQKLFLEKVPVQEVIRPVDMVITENYLVVQNDILDGQDQIFVYSLDSLHFLYSFQKRGHGPQEIVAPSLVQNDISDYVTVIDHASFKLLRYRLEDKSAVFCTEKVMELDEKQPLQEVYYCNDSVLVYSTLSNEIQTYNVNSQKVIDAFSFHSNISEVMGADYNKSFDAFHLGYFNGKINVGFHYLNKIARGIITGNGHIRMGDSIIVIKEKMNPTLFDNTWYYMYITMGQEISIAQFAGCSFRTFQPFPLNLGRREFKFFLEAYDCEGIPLKLMEIEEDIFRCKIDEKRKRIITWDLLNDFNHFMVYYY